MKGFTAEILLGNSVIFRESGTLITVNRYLSFLIAVNRSQDPPLPPLISVMCYFCQLPLAIRL